MEWMLPLLILLEMVSPLPLKDNRGRRLDFPIATASLVIINILIHATLVLIDTQGLADLTPLFDNLGIVPNKIFEQSGIGVLAFVTAGFLHASWSHVLGNVFILGFFGRKVEDLTGPLRFLLFYLLCLLGSGIASVVGRHALSPLEGVIPSIGASGAISGVMAAYLFLFAGERITTIVLFFIYPLPFPIPIPFPLRLPAWVYVVYSFGHDLLLGWLSEEFVKERGFSPFGTDVFAHMGGLMVGLIFIYLYLLPDVLIGHRHNQ